jgi:DNA-binding cell septation regulator SpoVG
MPDTQTRPSAARIIEWRPLRKNSLLGFAKVAFPSGMIISDITIMAGERGPWASPPSKPLIDRDGAVMKDASSGKVVSVWLAAYARS